MRVVILPSAMADLERVGDTISIDSPRRAATFVSALVQRCEALGEFPERFPLVPRYEARGVRRTVLGDYLIFYTVRAEAVFILHVRHGRMDLDALLFPEV